MYYVFICFGGLTWIEYNIREKGKEFLVGGSLVYQTLTLQTLTYNL